MRLKSLELQGFKSFPDKTTLHFENGITAIVGPNGSGKSNISDAVRWVLGEQSTRTLRGSKMEDVIFGGTQRRGQVGFAEVSLTIDNSDGVLPIEANDVTVTRRYYRSGESEFYVNRNLVRLRDIHEMFMDTGLGRDGYSIIGQGRIDEILSLKSEDRREVFEEASGISKFRHRKEEAERKLSATEENLVRIRDILSELEAQVGPLAEQAERARRYLTIYEELKGLEVNVWMYQLDRARENAEKLKNDYEVACEQFARAQSTVDELYRETEEMSEQMRARDVALEAERTRLQEAERYAQELTHEKNVLEGAISNNEENAARVRAELSEEANRAGGMRAQIEEREARIVQLTETGATLSAEIAELQARIAAALTSGNDLEQKLDGLRAMILSREAEINELRIRQSAETASGVGRGARLAAIERECTEREETRSETRARARSVREAYTEAEERLAELENSLRGFALKGESRKRKLQAAQAELQKGQITLESMREKQRILSDMEREYEGFSHAVKTVMRASERGELNGVCGMVSQLMQVPEEYAIAIEIALGGALGNLIVEDERAAKAGISYLKSCNGGRTTFYPLTTVRGELLRETGLEQEDGVCGIAAELITFDPRYRDVYRSLLGRVVIAENIDRAGALAKQHGYRFRIVTLDGQVVNAGGSYTGGSVGKRGGILSRANELKRLADEIARSESKMKQTAEAVSELAREVSALDYEIEVCQNEKREAEDALLRTRTETEHYTALLSALDATLDALEDEARTLRAEQSVRQREESELAQALSDAERARDELSATLAREQAGHSEMKDKQGALTTRLSELKLSAASVSAEAQEAQKSLTELTELSNAMAGDRAQKLALIDSFHAKNESIHAEIAEKEAEIASAKGVCDEMRATITEKQQDKLALEGMRNRKEREAKDKNDEILRLERERARLESKKEAAESEQSQITERLWESYELSISAAEALTTPMESVGTAKTRINQLKNERKVLGSVNVGAIEEYDRVAERFEFLGAQRADLEAAKTELLHKIDELTEQMQTIFAEQFAIINQNFGETFFEIFGGGSAELRLEDPDDILNCGIEIKVQPPGKTLKTITLLSGGERAFVAIALYFAILKVRPTPFCVLDEIEAALDDVNVVRYASYLRKLCTVTQFIVITHRRGTMEEADRLYGVTMQEQGISKMLTISIAEVERELHIKLK